MQAQDKKMLIGYIVGSFWIDLNGNEGCNIHISKTLEKIRENGHEVVLFSACNVIEKTNWHIIITKLFQKILSRILPTYELFVKSIKSSIDIYRKIVKSLPKPDVLHERYSLFCFGGAIAAKRLKVPLILEVNAPPIEEKRARGDKISKPLSILISILAKINFMLSHKIIVVSDELKDHLSKDWNIPENKVIVIPNGADPIRQDLLNSKNELRRSYGYPLEKPIVVFLGSMKKWHGVLNLIDAFYSVLQTVPGARLLLIGEGELLEEVRDRVDELQIEKSVEITGFLPHTDVLNYIILSDIAVAPYPKLNTIFYFSPIKIFEYMAAGKAIIASNIGQIAKILENDRSAMLINPGDNKQLTEAIVTLIRNLEMRERFGRNAMATFLRHYSWDANIDRLLKIYNESKRI